MPNLNAQLLNAMLTLASPTVSGNIVSSSAANPLAKVTAAFYEAYRQTTTSPDSVGLPISPCQVLYIRNLSVSANLLVTLTPTGGSAWVSPIVVVPAGVFTIFPSFNAAPGVGGFTALSLLSDSGTASSEVFLAG